MVDRSVAVLQGICREVDGPGRDVTEIRKGNAGLDLVVCRGEGISDVLELIVIESDGTVVGFKILSV